ncbi:hypothetical protein, partial [Cedecea sp. USHLN005]|uniref:hypothetical protein n=1 Tax=Cedecea sp. USHLN005 TaxID=3081239 RepID=UPI00301694F5
PTNVERRPKGAFLLSAIRAGFEPAAGSTKSLLILRVACDEPEGQYHPARPTNVERRPKGAFLLSAVSENPIVKKLSTSSPPGR